MLVPAHVARVHEPAIRLHILQNQSLMQVLNGNTTAHRPQVVLNGDEASTNHRLRTQKTDEPLFLRIPTTQKRSKKDTSDTALHLRSSVEATPTPAQEPSAHLYVTQQHSLPTWQVSKHLSHLVIKA